MRTVTRFSSVLLVIAVVAGFVLGTAVQAQDDMMEESITCDSTLATLLLVAEYNYDYLSEKMAMDMMDDPTLHIDLGVLQPVADEIAAMMMDMMEEDDMSDDSMSDEDMMAHDEMLNSMMGMSAADAVNAYMSSMNMETMDMMSELPTGALADEDPACTAVRADVEQFLLAHILTSMSTSGDM